MKRVELEIAGHKKRIEDLHNKIQLVQAKKREIIEYVKRLTLLHHKTKISNDEYNRELYRYLKGQSYEEWINYYDDYINECHSKIVEYNTKIRSYKSRKDIPKKLANLALSPYFIIFAVLALTFGYFLLTGIIPYKPTGLIIGEPNISISNVSIDVSGLDRDNYTLTVRTYSTEITVRGNSGSITEYFYPKFPIFNGTDYLSWEEGIKYQKTVDGIRVQTADGLDCSTRWSLSDKEILTSDNEEFSLSEFKNKKLKHKSIKDLRVYYETEVNETETICQTVLNESYNSELEECEIQTCNEVVTSKNRRIYLEKDNYSVDLNKGIVNLIDSSTLSGVNNIKIEYEYYDPVKNIPLEIEDIDNLRNNLKLKRGVSQF